MNPEDLLAAMDRAHEAGDKPAATKLGELYMQAVQSQQPPAQAPPMPQGGNIAGAVGQGLSFGFSDELAGGIGAGINSTMNMFGKGTGDSFGDAYRDIRDGARANKDAFAARNPKTALAAEIGGGLLTGGVGAARVGALKGAQSLGRLAGVGAAEGAVYGAGASDADTLDGVAGDAAIGGLLGGATGAAAPAIGKSVKGLLSGGNALLGGGNTAARKAAVEILEAADIPLTGGQTGGSKALQAAETTAAGVPVIGSPLETTLATQRIKLQEKLMTMAGFDEADTVVGELTEQAIDNAKDKFANRYAKALGGVELSLGDKFVDTLIDVQDKFTSSLKGSKSGSVVRRVNALFDQATDGVLTGEKYQKLRSELGEFVRDTALKPRTSRLYRELKSSLDDAFFNGVSVVKGKAKKAIDGDYAHFKQLQEIWEKGVGDSVEGMIPLGQLNRIANSAKSAGSQQWNRLVRAAKAIIPDATPNSGTAARGITGGLLGGAGVGSVMAPAAIPGILAGAAAGRGASSMLANPKGVINAAQMLQQGANKGGLMAAPVISQQAKPLLPPQIPGLFGR